MSISPFSPTMSNFPCSCPPSGVDGFGAMGGLNASGMDMGMLGIQQQILSMMMSMLSMLFVGGFGGGTPTGGGLPAVPGFGTGSANPGVSNFLGAPPSGGSQPSSRGPRSRGHKPRQRQPRSTRPSGSPNTSATAASGSTKAAAWGKKLADAARSHATGSGGLCYKYVAEDLAKFGVSVSGASAYMAADQLARSKKFREVKMSPSQLKSLPPGAVVVWNKGNGHEHGHISVALGGGKEASDVLRDQITSYGTSVRVFIPK